MKNNSSKSSSKRVSKKFNTTVKKPSSLLSNKLRKSMPENTIKSGISKPTVSRKSAIIPKSKALDKKKSIVSQKNNTAKSSKRASSSSQFKTDNIQNKSKKMSIKGRKSTKKSIKKDENINILKENQNKDKDINTLSENENNTKDLNSEESSKTNEVKSNKSKSNQENEKRISISSKNDKKEIQSKSQSKKGSLKENKIINNNELLKTKIMNEFLDPNKHIEINLVKETNDKPNYRYNYDINLANNMENQESRLRNYKVESSDYITEKNKYLIKNLLFILDKKPDDKKSTKNFFRQSLNALNNREENKILENLYRNKNDIFRIKQDERLNHINQISANKKLSDIYQNLFDHDYARNRFRSVENKYVEKRENDRYLGCNYNFMLNSIDNKLNNDYRDIYRRKKMQKIFDSINEDIYSLNPYHDNILRKTFSERNKNSLFL